MGISPTTTTPSSSSSLVSASSSSSLSCLASLTPSSSSSSSSSPVIPFCFTHEHATHSKELDYFVDWFCTSMNSTTVVMKWMLTSHLLACFKHKNTPWIIFHLSELHWQRKNPNELEVFAPIHLQSFETNSNLHPKDTTIRLVHEKSDIIDRWYQVLNQFRSQEEKLVHSKVDPCISNLKAKLSASPCSSSPLSSSPITSSKEHHVKLHDQTWSLIKSHSLSTLVQYGSSIQDSTLSLHLDSIGSHSHFTMESNPLYLNPLPTPVDQSMISMLDLNQLHLTLLNKLDQLQELQSTPFGSRSLTRSISFSQKSMEEEEKSFLRTKSVSLPPSSPFSPSSSNSVSMNSYRFKDNQRPLSSMPLSTSCPCLPIETLLSPTNVVAVMFKDIQDQCLGLCQLECELKELLNQVKGCPTFLKKEVEVRLALDLVKYCQLGYQAWVQHHSLRNPITTLTPLRTTMTFLPSLPSPIPSFVQKRNPEEFFPISSFKEQTTLFPVSNPIPSTVFPFKDYKSFNEQKEALLDPSNRPSSLSPGSTSSSSSPSSSVLSSSPFHSSLPRFTLNTASPLTSVLLMLKKTDPPSLSSFLTTPKPALTSLPFFSSLSFISNPDRRLVNSLESIAESSQPDASLDSTKQRVKSEIMTNQEEEEEEKEKTTTKVYTPYVLDENKINHQENFSLDKVNDGIFVNEEKEEELDQTQVNVKMPFQIKCNAKKHGSDPMSNDSISFSMTKEPIFSSCFVPFNGMHFTKENLQQEEKEEVEEENELNQTCVSLTSTTTTTTSMSPLMLKLRELEPIIEEHTGGTHHLRISSD